MTNIPVTDWSRCCLCQTKLQNITLRTPATSTYKQLAERLLQLKELNALPFGLNLKRLNEAGDIAHTLLEQKAAWHKECYDMCNEQKIQRARRKLSSENENTTSCRRSLRTSLDSKVPNTYSDCCFYCSENGGKLHQVEFLTLDENTRYMANEMMEIDILRKLSEGDMCARDAMYHKTCQTSFYNKYKAYQREQENVQSQKSSQNELRDIAFAELVSYIEYSQTKCEEPQVFILSDIVKLYTERLDQLRIDTRVHSTHLKEKLMKSIPDLTESKNGRQVVLTFKSEIGHTMINASQSNDNIISMMKLANTIRNEMFEMQYDFRGSLKDPRYSQLPTTLIKLIDMILTGPSISNKHDQYSTAATNLSQLIVYNTVKRQRVKEPTESYDITRHNLDRETMLPLYVGLLVHGKTRKKELVDALHDQGLSVSYRRVMDVSTDVANAVLQKYEQTGIVCPPNLKSGVYTTGNLDNIDHNPSSITASDSFHGTAISLTQHKFTHVDNDNVTPTYIDIDSTHSRSVSRPLPATYTDIPPTVFRTNQPQPVFVHGCQERPPVPSHAVTETDWLYNVRMKVESENIAVDKGQSFSWSAYRAEQMSETRPPATSALLPLFREEAHTPAMIKHGMNIVKLATEFTNPGQIPVLTVDQPLYVLAKKVQWLWPYEYGPDKYVIMMGGLHIEMSYLKAIGEWLEGSGWLNSLVTAEIVTAGRGESVQKGSSVARGQWIHQVMVAALHMLKQDAYKTHQVRNNQHSLSFASWSDSMVNTNPQFHYWTRVMDMELLLLKFIRSQREANFDMYIECLREMLPWFFLLDHVHYARWLTVHVQDLTQLQVSNQATFEQFSKGAFVTQKSTRKFSAMAHDQVHEQLNAILKGDGGFIGITENAETLKRWTVSAPELTRIISEVTTSNAEPTNHHDSGTTNQTRFVMQVQSLVRTMNELGNPFTENSSELLTLDTKVIMSQDSVKQLKMAATEGQVKYRKFLEGQNISFYDPIKKTKLQLFQLQKPSKSSTLKQKVQSMKDDVSLFSRMYIACQNRGGDMENFFRHENHPYPPALAEHKVMRFIVNKSDLLDPLEKMCEAEDVQAVDCRIIDGAALVQSLEPKNAYGKMTTFQDYIDNLFRPYILKRLLTTKRLDIVWDVYIDNSLKAQTRKNRGSGDTIKVAPSTTLPTATWKNFLRNDSNKSNFYRFLSQSIPEIQVPPGKCILSTVGNQVLHTNSEIPDITAIVPCNHEEADYRMMLHAANAMNNGAKQISISATDTDVVVLAVALSSLYKGCKIWVAFGHGAKDFRYIPAHTISEKLGPASAWGLLLLHAISGCDTVSQFAGIGKKTAFAVWASLPEIHTEFRKLSLAPESVSSDDMLMLERFVVLLYSRTSSLSTVNDARQYMFGYQGRQIDHIPPTKDALHQHVLRAVFQAGHVWGQMLVKCPPLPSPSNWGWKQDEDENIWIPNWTTLPEASKACPELIKCKCQVACSGRCKCCKANLPCTKLCLCGGNCERDN